MEKFRLDAAATLTPLMISKYIEKYRGEEAHLKTLYEYYKGNNAINHRVMNDVSKPNNKVANPFATYITDTFTGYFLGEPVSYNSEDAALLDNITAIFDYNDEASTNSELAKDASIFGVAYELLYIDENADIRFRKIDAVKGIPIYDNTLEEDLLYFIRYYDEEDIISGNTTTYVEVYSRSDIQFFKSCGGALTLTEQRPHSFGAVPINIYENNQEKIGDFETVISLIDAYDKITSDSVNDLEYFADCYLALYGMSGTEPEDITAMKEQRVLLLEQDARAEWLTKAVNDGYIENLKNRLDEQIHKFSRCPALTDENFAANASGVAMKYKLMGIETATAKKERAFKKAIQRRIELICNILSVMGTDYNYLSVKMNFKRNIPANLVEMADVVNKIGNLLSEETALSLLPIDCSYEEEQKRKEEEQAANGLTYDFSQPIGDGE